MPPPGHIPVLAAEIVAHLAPVAGEVYLDCTAGLGGHAALIAPAVGETGTIALCDLDASNLGQAEGRLRRLPTPPRVIAMRGNFAEAPGWMARQGLRADMVLADLGFASTQVDDPTRGLSFSRPGPLDMRLDPSGALTAAQFVAAASEHDLARVIDEFGEERHARLVARRIVEARKVGPITTTDQLAGIIRAAVGPRGSGGIDPATRTFQALRIAVNDELGNLHALMAAIRRGAKPMSTQAWLKPGARIAIISFHSLEDRPVKQAFAELVESGAAEHVVRKPVTASDDELRQNPRSRSAKLRVIRIVSPP